MKGLENELGSNLKPSREERRAMKQYFEGQILTAALLRGRISAKEYEGLLERRLNLNLKKKM